MWTALAAVPMTEPGQNPTAAVRACDNAHANTDFAALFAEHAPHIWRAVRNLGVREADIEDVCQEVFVVVHRKLATFEGRSALRTWIYGIALRVVADYRKKAHRKHERLMGELPERGIHAQQELAASQQQAWRMLAGLLDSLSEERRRVFVLYELEQLPMREVAALIECPLQTAYSRLEAAREIVQRGMAEWREQERHS
jgi:RNA polymerase sigma-70 factor, ECF subfamily